MMLERHDALGLQQDAFNALELYLNRVPSFPPEECNSSNCFEKLSIEDVEAASTLVIAYLGLAMDPGEIGSKLRESIRKICLNR